MTGLIVDSFAGGGGASLGIEMALDRSPDIAINHDAEAVAMHAANHPATRHFCRSVWQVDPLDAVHGQPVELLWASPDCKHFSKAKGGKPVARHIRDLAWVVVLWAKRARPRVICLENVEEFRTWGPVLADGQPCRERRGETFERWLRELRRLGYRVEHRELRACDFGAPTIRRRLFLIARRDGLPIAWPEPTHGAPGSPDVLAGRLKPWRTAAECIDWSLPCPSIFLSREAGRTIGVNRPLADATMARIARGVRRYVLEAAAPFIVRFAHGESRGRREFGLGEPLPTQPASREFGLAAPFLAPITHSGDQRVHGLGEPVRTVTAARRGEHALVAPFLAAYYGEGAGGRDRAASPAEPLRTATTENRHALCTAFLAQHNGGPRNAGLAGHDLREPVSTITGTGSHQQLVAATLSHLYSSNTGGGQGDVRQPLKTVTAGGGHHALLHAFLTKYYGEGGQDQDCREPLHTVPTRDRYGLVMVAGELFQLVDIGMRMLSPRELFRAQGFPDGYVIDPVVDGRRLSRTAQIRMCGNSVCPPLAAAIVRANLGAASSSGREAA